MPDDAPLPDPQIRNTAQRNSSPRMAQPPLPSVDAFRDELAALMVQAGMDEAEARALLEESTQASDDDIVATAVPPEAEAALRRGDRALAVRIVQDAMALDSAEAGEVVAAMTETPVAIKRDALERPPLAAPPAAQEPPRRRAWPWPLAAFAILAALLLLWLGASRYAHGAPTAGPTIPTTIDKQGPQPRVSSR